MKNVKAKEIDFGNEAQIVIEFSKDISDRNFNLTITQAVGYLKGTDISRLSRIADIKKNYFKKLSYLDQSVIKRIIIRLMILKVLKEKFIQMKDNSNQIHSFITVGRKYNQFFINKMKLYLSCPHEKRFKTNFELVVPIENEKTGEIGITYFDPKNCDEQKIKFSDEITEEPSLHQSKNWTQKDNIAIPEATSNEWILINNEDNSKLNTHQIEECKIEVPSNNLQINNNESIVLIDEPDNAEKQNSHKIFNFANFILWY